MPSNQQKKYRASAILLGIFWAIIRQVLSVWLPNGKKTPFANTLSPIILLQNSLQVRQSVKNLSSNLRVWENAFVPIVLQGAGREEEPFAYLSSCEIEFSLKQGAVCLCCCPHMHCEVSDARDELLHFKCFFADGFIFHSSFYL